MLVGLGFKRSLQDCVAVTTKKNHNVLVSTAKSYRKATCMIRVKLWDGILPAVHLICDLSREVWWGDRAGLKLGWGLVKDFPQTIGFGRWLCCLWWIGICWAHIMACLCHGTFDCFMRRMEVLGCILICQARPRGKISSLYVIQTFDLTGNPSSS